MFFSKSSYSVFFLLNMKWSAYTLSVMKQVMGMHPNYMIPTTLLGWR